MLRLLIIILLLVLLFALIKRFLPGKPPPQDEPRIAKIVRCDYCQIYIPHTSAIKHAERYYCCDEHKEAASGNAS